MGHESFVGGLLSQSVVGCDVELKEDKGHSLSSGPYILVGLCLGIL